MCVCVCARACVSVRVCVVTVVHSVLVETKILGNLDHKRVLLRPSETTITTSGDTSYGGFYSAMDGPGRPLLGGPLIV